MTKKAFLNDEEIQKFLAEDDDLIDSDEDDCAIGELETDLGELSDEENSSEGVSSDEDDIPLNVLLEKSNIITFSKTILRGKNRHMWSTQKARSYRYGQNIVHQVRGPTRLCKNIVDPIQVFRLFITDAIIKEIVEWTNVEISTRSCINSTEAAQRKETNNEEIEALIGMLALTAAMKDNHLTSTELFDPSCSGSKYLSIMTHNRFRFLMSCLRFDDKSVRIHLTADKLAPIRKAWDIFIQKCRENYTPGPYMTIDEQLISFRGRCGFKMYIPNKPSNYGLKVVMMCDSGTKYMVDAKPYLGKGSINSNLPLAENYVKELTKSIYGTNRNVTMDNWFTSVSLAKSLLKEPHKLTLVGTLRSNKREIPPEMKVSKGRKCGTSIFAYDNELTLLSYKPKPNKIIYLLSSCNEIGTVNNTTKKPHMIEFYNSTKGGVDTFDQMCSVMSCARKPTAGQWQHFLVYSIWLI
ncbi:piggyBac transposable element-derived protein 4-like [Eurosta solidaginis]|uniref:piggyBac transposable element-derived protein 4-like n=1 Tax=Eurosta solidaginis TaxID=178769 RepID=UPI0035312138